MVPSLGVPFNLIKSAFHSLLLDRHPRVAHREVRPTDAGHETGAIGDGGHGPHCVDEPALHPLGAIHRPGRVRRQSEGCVCHIDCSLIMPFRAAIKGASLTRSNLVSTHR